MVQIDIVVAAAEELPSVGKSYASQGYTGARIEASDFVVVGTQNGEIVGVGRLCQGEQLLWLRGMQVKSNLQRRGVGKKILRRLEQEIGSRWCCCVPYRHLIDFYRQAGFEEATGCLPPPLQTRLASYLSRGLKVVAMVRAAHQGGKE